MGVYLEWVVMNTRTTCLSGLPSTGHCTTFSGNLTKLVDAACSNMHIADAFSLSSTATRLLTAAGDISQNTNSDHSSCKPEE